MMNNYLIIYHLWKTIHLLLIKIKIMMNHSYLLNTKNLLLLKIKKNQKVDASVKIQIVLDYIALVLKTKVIVDLNANV